jgi:FMN phosphatase YigB (HAD superfamily)
MKSSFHDLPAAIASAARSEPITLIGFDVFDTLLRRRVEPETVKDIVARRLVRLLTDLPPHAPLRSWGMPDWRLLREKRRLLEVELGHTAEIRGHDHEFRLRDMMTIWVRRCAQPLVPHDIIQSFADQLVEHELRCERAATTPTQGIIHALETARAAAKRVIFVSDSYLSIADIRHLLASSGLLDFLDAGYVSSEFMLTKRSGRLFERVLVEEGVSPASMLFIGDNPHSDVASPRSRGIRTIHIADKPEAARRARLQLLDSLSRQNTFWVGRHAREVVEALPTALARTDADAKSPHYRLGELLAPGFLAFTLHILEKSQELGLRRLFFLSREGLTFLRMYRRIVRELGVQHVTPQAEYAVVSRASTFLASSDSFDIPGLQRIWAQYHGQSLSRIIRNFSLPLDELTPLAQAAGFEDLDRPILDLHTEPALARFFADPAVQGIFTRERNQARELFTQYMRDRGWFDGDGSPSDSVGVVDIGWKGSIQNNMYRALAYTPNAPAIVGFYFGLTHHHADTDPRNAKLGFMADTRSADWVSECIFKNGSVFEMFSTAMHGGAAGYRRTPDGRVKATIRIDASEQRNFTTHFADVRRGIEDYTTDFLSVLPLIDCSSMEMRPDFLDTLRRYILYPRRAEAKAFLEYTHVENFGIFQVTNYRWNGSWRKILKGNPKGMPHRLLHELRQQIWPEAICKRSAVPFANLAYDLIDTRRAARYVP